MSIINKIIEEICNEEKIEYKKLSKNWITQLKKGGRVKYIIGTRFPLNSQTSNMIASDKYATYEVLKSEGINIIEYNIVFNPKTRHHVTSDIDVSLGLKKYIKEHNNKIVIKANEGFGGRNVFLCNGVLDAKKAIEKIFERKDSLSICPFYDAVAEYRVIMLDNEPELIYGKEKKDSGWKFNLSQGARAFEVTDKGLKEELISIAKKCVKAMDLRFASVDIIQTTNEELLVMEVNSGVTINKYTNYFEKGYETAKKIYKKAIEKCFE